MLAGLDDCLKKYVLIRRGGHVEQERIAAAVMNSENIAFIAIKWHCHEITNHHMRDQDSQQRPHTEGADLTSMCKRCIFPNFYF